MMRAYINQGEQMDTEPTREQTVRGFDPMVFADVTAVLLRHTTVDTTLSYIASAQSEVE